MTRSKRGFLDRSTGINISVPLWLVQEIDKECKKRQVDRSTLIREALASLVPSLRNGNGNGNGETSNSKDNNSRDPNNSGS